MIQNLKKNHICSQVLEFPADQATAESKLNEASQLEIIQNLKIVDWRLDVEMQPVV